MSTTDKIILIILAVCCALILALIPSAPSDPCEAKESRSLSQHLADRCLRIKT